MNIYVVKYLFLENCDGYGWIFILADISILMIVFPWCCYSIENCVDDMKYCFGKGPNEWHDA
jgi:hypothetical protein